MPVYVYRDTDGKLHERSHSVDDPPLTEIDGKSVHRVPQIAGVTFKGDGWARS